MMGQVFLEGYVEEELDQERPNAGYESIRGLTYRGGMKSNRKKRCQRGVAVVEYTVAISMLFLVAFGSLYTLGWEIRQTLIMTHIYMGGGTIGDTRPNGAALPPPPGRPAELKF